MHFAIFFFNFFAFSVDHFYLIFRASITDKLHLSVLKHNFWMIFNDFDKKKLIKTWTWNMKSLKCFQRTKCVLAKKNIFFKNTTYLNCTGTVPTSFSRPGPCPVLAGPCPVLGGLDPKMEQWTYGYSCLR